MGLTDNTPNFDQMTPEEIMAWMESLAKRQGANEGFTTAADVEVPEIDPNTVVIDEPGYVPYGQEDAVVQKPAARSSASQPPPSPIAQPTASGPPLEETSRAAEPEPALSSVIGENALAWLESLAADQSNTDLSLDFSSLEPEPELKPAEIDPVSWLKNMAEQPELSGAPAQSITDKAEEEDTGMGLLETIARRSDTSTDLGDLPITSAPADVSEPSKTPLELENPAAWLDSLAVASGFEDEAVRAVPQARQQTEVDMSIEGIERAIREGRVTPEQIKAYQEYSMERAFQTPEPEIIDDDADAPAEPIAMPDWLAEMKAEADKTDEMAAASRPPLETLFDAAPVQPSDIPDWLQDDGSDSEDVDAIFAAPTGSSLEVDYGDPWVEAFDEEYERGSADIEDVPDWYVRNVMDPERIALIEGTPHVPPAEPEQIIEAPAPLEPLIASLTAQPLVDAALPSEASLPTGERQAVPSWMIGTSTQTAAAAAAPKPAPEEAVVVSAEPDWLRETDEQPAAAVPDWLDHLSDLPAEPPIIPVPPAAAPVYVPPPAPPPPPVVTATLDEARVRSREGDLEGSLKIYEVLVRASQSLTDVSSDLVEIAQTQKKNPAVFRVLGDSLMRQGRLQDALNTYREALNWL